MVTGEVEKFVAETKGLPTRDELIELLRNEVVEVTFTKLDGDERVMPCTLQAKYFPDPKKESTQKTRDSLPALSAREGAGHLTELETRFARLVPRESSQRQTLHKEFVQTVR